MKRQPSVSEIKRLFAVSGGRCAFPGCANNLLPVSGAVLAEIAHINAASVGGPRFDRSQAQDERHGFDNLILLCPTHHALIDTDQVHYGAHALREMKRIHETEVRRRLEGNGGEVANLEPRAATQLARQVDVSVADVCIITALPLELASVLEYFPTLEKVTIRPDSRTYFQGIVVADDGVTRYRLVVAMLTGMGNVLAAAATAEVIQDWNPRYIVVCGIAGGLKRNEQCLGDVVVSTSVIYYELAKLHDHGPERRPVSYPADSLMLDRAMHMHAMPAWRGRLPLPPSSMPANVTFPAVHFGPVASGDKVIASAAEAHQLLKLHPKLAAVEMEGGGVAASAFATARRVGFFMVRGICDFADQTKNDGWQHFAAKAAASFVAQLLASRPIAPSDGDWVPDHRASSVTDPNWVRTVLFPRLCSSLNMDEFRNMCFVLQVDVDDLEGTSKSAKIRELLLRAERRGRLSEILRAYEGLVEQELPP